MKEIVFINRNSDKWSNIEKSLEGKIETTPDELYDLYIGINNDLSYANTFFPQSEVSTYLNNLALQAHQNIYQNKKVKKGRFKTFWKRDYPLLMKENRNYIWFSLAIFIISIFIGIVSTSVDAEFPRIILGDRYVNTTLENIGKNDPMAVYKKANEVDMFLGISVNNIRVAFYAFVAGVFFSVGTGYVLFQNGIMLGCFQYFFYQHGLLGESMLTIWIHGTLEIFAIIIAGAAGLRIGNSLLFPGTYKRIVSFQKGAVAGVKMVSGLVPIFLVAGFLEGFVTRHTEFPDSVRMLIILASLAFIIWYFFLYPNKIHKQINHEHKV